MFDFDAGKLIVIAIVALIVIPAKDLPRVLRQLGQVIGKMRRMAAEFQGQLKYAIGEVDDLRDARNKLEEDLRKAAHGAELDASFDPMTTIREQMVGAIEGKERTSPPDPAAGNLPPIAQEPPPEALALPGGPPGQEPLHEGAGK